MSTTSAGNEQASQLAIAARRAVTALTGLEYSLSHLRLQLEHEIEGASPPTFLVDWDVVQMFAEFRLTSSIYAASVIKGFEKAAEENLRLVVPQGTRMEFTYYVSGLAKSLRLRPNSETEIGTETEPQGLYKDRQRYERQHLKLSRARNISEIASLLDKFCSTYGESLALLHDGYFVGMPMSELEKTEVFQRAYGQVAQMRREGIRRNRADAANIAILDIAEYEGKDYRLVSGTSMLGKLRPGKVVDPFSFLLRLHLATTQRTKQRAALSNLRKMHLHVLALLNRSTTVMEGVEGGAPYITRRQAQDWIRHLDAMESDPIIGETVRLITAVHLDAENRISLTRMDNEKISTWSPEGHITEVRHAVSHLGGLVSSMYANSDPLADLNYKWSPMERIGEFIERVLLSRKSEIIVRISVSQNCMVVSWPTASRLIDFLKIIDSKLERGEIEPTASSTIRVYYRDRPTRVLPVDQLSILEISEEGPRSVRPDAIRFFFTNVHYIYELGEEPENMPQLGAIADWDSRDATLELFASTFIDFVPLRSINEVIDSMLESLASAA